MYADFGKDEGGGRQGHVAVEKGMQKRACHSAEEKVIELFLFFSCKGFRSDDDSSGRGKESKAQRGNM